MGPMRKSMSRSRSRIEVNMMWDVCRYQQKFATVAKLGTLSGG